VQEQAAGGASSTVLLLRLAAPSRPAAETLLRELWQKVNFRSPVTSAGAVASNEFAARVSRARLGELGVSALAFPPSTASGAAASGGAGVRTSVIRRLSSTSSSKRFESEESAWDRTDWVRVMVRSVMA
jgi:hypothetical protein